MKECSLCIVPSAPKRNQMTSSDVKKKKIKYCKHQNICGASNKTYA